MLAWETLAVQQPFEGLPVQQRDAAAVKGNRPDLGLLDAELADTGIADLISACWSRDTVARPSISAVVDRLAAVIDSVSTRQAARLREPAAVALRVPLLNRAAPGGPAGLAVIAPSAAGGAGGPAVIALSQQRVTLRGK